MGGHQLFRRVKRVPKRLAIYAYTIDSTRKSTTRAFSLFYLKTSPFKSIKDRKSANHT